MPAAIDWTEDMDASLLRYWRQDVQIKVIARRLQITPSAVSRRIDVLRKEHPDRWPKRKTGSRSDGMVMLHFYVAPATAQKLSLVARARGVSASTFLRHMVEGRAG